MHRVLTFALTLGLGAGTTSLSAQAVSEADQEVVDQAQEWLAFVDADDYEESWSRTAPMFQAQVTAEQWEEAGEQVRSEIGGIVEREVQQVSSTSPPGVPAGEYRVIQYRSTFENSPASTETIILREEEPDDWQVVGYFVRPA